MRRFIEETFPVKEVSAESSREKSIRHGHISTLHIWWARRPLAASRATAYAALTPAPKNIDEWNRKREFIAQLCKWENSDNQQLLEKARKEILEANGGVPPKVLDPFGGGGSIPLEALRLGCETYSNDYNPVAVLIQKCTLEYPQKYGKPGYVEREVEEFGRKLVKKEHVDNVLLEDVKKWGNWVLEQVKKEIGRFYPNDDDGSVPVGYIWARTIPCQNPSCGAEIPLMRQYWLAKKKNKKVALYPYIEENRVLFRIIGDGYEKWPEGYDPGKGTVSRAVATCPVCGSVVEAKNTRKLFQEEKSGERMIAVVLHKPGQRGKRYRLSTKKDLQVFNEAEEYLEEKVKILEKEWGMSPVPDEPLPPTGTLGFRIQRYNMKSWGDLFNSRQKLAILTFSQKSLNIALGSHINKEYKKVISTFLSLSIDSLADHNSVLCQWRGGTEDGSHTFGRQALPMNWDYFEVNLLSGSTGSFQSATPKLYKCIDHCSSIENRHGNINQLDSTSLKFNNDFFDTVFTDPPYYDNVPYSYLSDFFYVWLKRSVGHLYPELFSTPLTPKKNEIVAYSNGPGGWEGGKVFFEDMLKKSFCEIHRVLKPDGIAVIVYAHKSTEGWETLINSLLDSGLIVTGAWPINTEMNARLRAKESAALASSIYIVARKMKRKGTGFYNDVSTELRNHLDERLERLWQEGIGGADFFISAIGSAIEVFGKYEKVMDYEGNVIRADRLLMDVRKIATDFTVSQILHNGFGAEITDLTRFYVLYRWNFGNAKAPFDEARKLAQSCGVDLALEWNRDGFIQKKKEFIEVYGPEKRKMEDLKDSSKLVDVLHYILLLWEKGKRNELVKHLSKTGYGGKESFFRVGQAVAESLPPDAKEKKLLEGFLSGRERLKDEIKKVIEKPIQTDIFDKNI